MFHTYFDDPEEHFDWVIDGSKILIQVKNNSRKGKNSIEYFELSNEAHCAARAKHAIYEDKKFDSETENYLMDITGYKKKSI
ncbi:hypothetical protein [Sporosalibacterium faouarense]|uniref:hypothetical protein n=1 Tax=Sporosalibacterium faouarense TaxID=516123 RepID=UPI00192CA01D|nr:hypothetical protein [Sporosalibacterium faouarense]